MKSSMLLLMGGLLSVGAMWSLHRWVSTLSVQISDGPQMLGWSAVLSLWPVSVLTVVLALCLSLVVGGVIVQHVVSFELREERQALDRRQRAQNERLAAAEERARTAVSEAQVAAKTAVASEFQHAEQMQREAEGIVARATARANAAETKARNAAGQVAGLKAQLDRHRHRDTQRRASL